MNPTYDHASMKQKVGVSNLKMFDGEDLTGGDRRRIQQMQMNQWIQQQQHDKDNFKQTQKNERDAWDQYTLECNQTRKELEEESQRRRTELEIANHQANIELMKEKLDREEQQTNQATKEKLEHAQFISTNDVWTENPKTSQSALAAHRVIPYHYKGMNADQRGEIRNEQGKQREEKLQNKQQQKDDEKMWSQYNEHNRKMLVNLEREKDRKSKEMMNHTKEFNLLASQEQKIKLKNEYA